jgi:hypothetical protein
MVKQLVVRPELLGETGVAVAVADQTDRQQRPEEQGAKVITAVEMV